MADDLQALKTALEMRAETLCFYLLPGGKIEAGEFVASGDITGFGKVGVVIRGAKTGRVGFWAGRPDDPAKEGGDLIHLIMAVNRLRLGEALKWAREWVGGAATPVEVHEYTPKKQDENKLRAWMIERARKLFDAASPEIKGTLAQAYFEARGVQLDWARLGPDVRFARRCEHWRSGGRGADGRRVPGPVYPAIVCAARDAAGGFLGAHFTFLRPDGGGKAPVEAPKLMMGDTNQGWITLGNGQPGGLCVLNEGVENGATVMMAEDPPGTHWHFVAPSLSALKRVVFPADCAGVILCPHNDWGNDAALRQFRAARDELSAQGKPIRILRAQGGNDPNDMVR